MAQSAFAAPPAAMASPKIHAMNDASLHEAIISGFLEHQRPPTILEIAERFQCDEVQARDALRTLADNHGVVLHSHSDEVWIAHPFSAAPTTCVVKSGNRKWWGNCAWCSLGLVHLAGDRPPLRQG